MDTLLDLVGRMESLETREAVRLSNGLRTWTYSYRDLSVQIRRFAGYLDRSGFAKGDRILLWCENRLEWAAAFWGAVSRGVVLVPVDPHATVNRIARIHEQASARLLVYGAATEASALEVERFSVDDLDALPDPAVLAPFRAAPDDVVEILYTSGTTSEAKGVVHRHRNICANLTPIDREIQRYRRWARPFQPIRFLNVLPLSHMFGQSMGMFVPVMLGGAVVFLSDLHPGTLERTIWRERVSVLVSVPRILSSLESHLVRQHPETAAEPSEGLGRLRRLWRYRAVHRAFGWKFWAFVVGGAELDPSAEAFWRRIGFLIVQGYGLTETSPVVSVNHPFHTRAGTLGRAIGDQEIKIASDGEILVRGSSVVDEYLGQAGVPVRVSDSDGWFHTGDVGMIDADGRLIYRGRKKDVIVTSEGLNVHPEDVERVLGGIPDVRASVVVAERGPRGERPHAVLILEDGADAAGIVEAANRQLEPEQRVQSWSLWPEADFPRTPSTEKVQRRLVAAAIRERRPQAPPGTQQAGASDLAAMLTGLTRRPLGELDPAKRLAEDLGLSSLERVDLMSEIEQRYGIQMDETRFAGASTLGELTAEVASARSGAVESGAGAQAARKGGREAGPPQPRWARHLLVRGFRGLIQTVLIRPLLAYFVKISVAGSEHLENLTPPVLFAANHASNLDAPVVLAGLPRRWRKRLAPAVRREFFFPVEGTGSRWRSLALRVEYALTCAAFNAYPLPQHLGRVRESLRYTAELVGAGYCPLVFPEGGRTPDGRIQAFRPGIGFMAVRLEAPVVPVYLDGTFEIFPIGSRWPRKGRVRVEIGAPLAPLRGESYGEFTGRLEEALRSME